MAELYGGHDCKFVEGVSDRLNCTICTKVLRDPHLSVCCGQHFCESCLNEWFTRQGKESCPHCRAEGDAFHHVIHKGLRSEINELKIRCSNHGEGCQWTGELGALKEHLESDSGCGFVIVECPNTCVTFGGTMMMKRKDLQEHLTLFCYRRPYQCEFCGLKDTYEAITGDDYIRYMRTNEDNYLGHQAKCPEVPLTCPNKCGSNKIKRKNIKSHRSQCPQETVECPFAEAGCKINILRHQLENHMAISLQKHLTLLTVERKQLKKELYEVKAKLSKAETELSETKHKLCKSETRLPFSEKFNNSANQLKNRGDSVKVTMPKFSNYRHSRKVWRSPPFYYREGYKMCLDVYANGTGNGTGTHVSVSVLLLMGEYDDQLKWPMKCSRVHLLPWSHEGHCQFFACSSSQRPAIIINQCAKISHHDKFCDLNGSALKLVNDCLIINVIFDDCYLIVSIA